MEIIDLYKDQHAKINAVMERNTTLPKGTFGLIVFACVFNSKGELLIQLRDQKKKGWAGLWDVSACGGVQAGETSLAAVRRETKEEIGLDIAKERFCKVLSLYYHSRIHDFYTVQMDVDLKKLRLQKEEVCQVKWATEEDVLEMIDRGEFVAVYKEFIQLLFRMKTRKGILL